ncbi:MAG: VIT domain-containing protein, partial [Candidatus Methylomirabilales bacterium]
MKRPNGVAKTSRTIAFLNVLFVAALIAGFAASASAQGRREKPQPAKDPVEEDVTQGALRVRTEAGVVECPLQHTDVQADISGFIARVTVRQTFFNPYDEKIEAVYVFPLPHTAAVDDMTMVIGDRRIVGMIKRRA